MTAPSPTLPSISATDDDGEGRLSLRGWTTVAERVVERIAAQAVSEVDDAGGSARRILGVAVGGAGLANVAQVSARIDGETASVDVRLSVGYPTSVAHTTERVRAHLTHRLQELTGLAVTRVDIIVTALHSRETEGRRVR